MNREQENKQKLEEFARRLQLQGFNVIASRKYPFQWLYFEKGDLLGTVSPDYFFGFTFASVNKPSQSHGTGSVILERAELAVRTAEQCLTFLRPGAERYKNAEDFINSNAWADYYILPREEAHETAIAD